MKYANCVSGWCQLSPRFEPGIAVIVPRENPLLLALLYPLTKVKVWLSGRTPIPVVRHPFGSQFRPGAGGKAGTAPYGGCALHGIFAAPRAEMCAGIRPPRRPADPGILPHPALRGKEKAPASGLETGAPGFIRPPGRCSLRGRGASPRPRAVANRPSGRAGPRGTGGGRRAARRGARTCRPARAGRPRRRPRGPPGRPGR
jgi:hypothetical protein